MAAVLADRIEARFFEAEHRRLRRGLGLLSETVEALGRADRDQALDRATRTLAWLREDLLPHIGWEEAWLYPRLDEEAGTAAASRWLRLQHEQLRDLGRRCEATVQANSQRWNVEVAIELTASLARLEAVVTAHLGIEEAIVSPMLQGVTPDIETKPEEADHAANPRRL